jgi:GH15 family glucan-1,4-alpha-glucosidase
VRDHGLDGPVEEWERLRGEIREEIDSRGWDPVRNTYVQHYGSSEVDASLLLLSQNGFIDANDPRMLGTVAAIEHDLMDDGLVLRYRTESGVDGLPGGEHPFLACSFWLVEQYARSGRLSEARTLMDRLVGLCNDVGLLSEEYAIHSRRQAGNVPQAFSHLALVRAADAVAAAAARAEIVTS